MLHQNGTILQENPIPTDETNYYAIIVGIDEYENNSNVNNNAETAISFFNQLTGVLRFAKHLYFSS